MSVLLRSYGSFSLSPSVIGLYRFVLTGFGSCLWFLFRACACLVFATANAKLLVGRISSRDAPLFPAPIFPYGQQGDGLALALLLPCE